MFVISTGESDDQRWLNMMKYFLNGSADKRDKDKAPRLNHFSHLHTHISEQNVYTTESSQFNWDINAPNAVRLSSLVQTLNKWINEMSQV